MLSLSYKLLGKKKDLQELELPSGEKALLFSRVNAQHEVTEWRKKYSILLFAPDFTQKGLEMRARTIVKKKWCDAIVDVDMMPKKDSMHQYTSLLDNGLLKECAKADVQIFATLQSIQNPASHESYLMRVLQTRRLCKKYGVVHNIVNISTEHVSDIDLSSLVDLF